MTTHHMKRALAAIDKKTIFLAVDVYRSGPTHTATLTVDSLNDITILDTSSVDVSTTDTAIEFVHKRIAAIQADDADAAIVLIVDKAWRGEEVCCAVAKKTPSVRIMCSDNIHYGVAISTEVNTSGWRSLLNCTAATIDMKYKYTLASGAYYALAFRSGRFHAY